MVLYWKLIRFMEHDLFLDKECRQWTGIRIFVRTILYVPFNIKLAIKNIDNKESEVWNNVDIALKPPTYRIDFSPDLTPASSYTVMELSTLNRAKRIAEEYYGKWYKVNKG